MFQFVEIRIYDGGGLNSLMLGGSVEGSNRCNILAVMSHLITASLVLDRGHKSGEIRLWLADERGRGTAL